MVRLDRPKCYYARVFHASQIEGMPPLEVENSYKWEPLDKAEQILTASNAVIEHDAVQAAYSPEFDVIKMPPKVTFPSPEDYYSTALHELSHWTGHESRLNRDLVGYSDNKESYAKEELRAEISSLFVAMETGIPFDPHNNASYVAAWVKALKDDKNEIFKAARDADRITDYIMEFGKEKDNVKGEIAVAKEVEVQAGSSKAPVEAEKPVKEDEKAAAIPDFSNAQLSLYDQAKEKDDEIVNECLNIFDKFFEHGYSNTRALVNNIQ